MQKQMGSSILRLLFYFILVANFEIAFSKNSTTLYGVDGRRLTTVKPYKSVFDNTASRTNYEQSLIDYNESRRNLFIQYNENRKREKEEQQRREREEKDRIWEMDRREKERKDREKSSNKGVPGWVIFIIIILISLSFTCVSWSRTTKNASSSRTFPPVVSADQILQTTRITRPTQLPTVPTTIYPQNSPSPRPRPYVNERRPFLPSQSLDDRPPPYRDVSDLPPYQPPLPNAPAPFMIYDGFQDIGSNTQNPTTPPPDFASAVHKSWRGIPGPTS